MASAGDGSGAGDGARGLRGVLGAYSDVMLAALVVGILGMMLVPLPTLVVDLLLTLNITVAVVLLMVALYIPRALDIAAFPSILLLTTLFGLGLNVSTTRLILLDADAGRVVEAFGHFVVQGNYVVGGVIFLIITIIQFVVIAKGSERVSEVAARFTLDAMPGKQMSIDADLRAGAFDIEEAQRRRAELQTESQLFGSLDGAMKFVKGDAIAGIVVTAINIIAGLIIGVFQQGMAAGTAAETYTLLTIGDGLVSQIPALLISTTSGIIVTRVAGEDESHLGGDIVRQILAHPKALIIASGLLAVLGIIPGLPTLPFLAMGAVAGAIAYGVIQTDREVGAEMDDADAEDVQAMEREAEASAAQASVLMPATTPLSVALGVGLTEEMSRERLDWLRDVLPSMREGLFYERGVKVPAVQLRTDAASVGDRRISIQIDEVEVADCRVPEDRVLCNESPGGLDVFEMSGQAARHPVSRTAASWIDAEHAETIERAGYKTWDVAGLVLLHLTAALQRHADQFVTIQSMRSMLDQLEGPYPALVAETIPKLVDLQTMTEVCRRLAEEGISLRQLPTILDVVADRAQFVTDPVDLAEEVRAGLSRYITDAHASDDGQVVVYVVDAEIERIVEGAVRRTDTGTFLSLPPDVSREILEAVRAEIEPDLKAGREPILLTSAEVRRYIHKLVTLETDHCIVLSYRELDPSLSVQPLGRVTV